MQEHIGDEASASVTYAHEASPSTSPVPGSSIGQLQAQQSSALRASGSTSSATTVKTYPPPPGPPPATPPSASNYSTQGSDTGSATNADDLQKAFARQSLTDH